MGQIECLAWKDNSAIRHIAFRQYIQSSSIWLKNVFVVVGFQISRRLRPSQTKGYRALGHGMSRF